MTKQIICNYRNCNNVFTKRHYSTIYCSRKCAKDEAGAHHKKIRKSPYSSTDTERAKRKCLRCLQLFTSKWKGNRICRECTKSLHNKADIENYGLTSSKEIRFPSVS